MLLDPVTEYVIVNRFINKLIQIKGWPLCLYERVKTVEKLLFIDNSHFKIWMHWVTLLEGAGTIEKLPYFLKKAFGRLSKISAERMGAYGKEGA